MHPPYHAEDLNVPKSNRNSSRGLRKSLGFLLAAAFCGALMSTSASAQTTYTWNQTGTASYVTSTNWTPTRTTPATNDVLVFNNAATTTVTNVPSETDGALLISGGTNVTLQAAATATLTLSGGLPLSFSIDSTSTLTLSGSNILTISLASGSTGAVSGQMTVSGAAHRLTVVSALAINFQSGGVFTTSTGFSGNPFTGSPSNGITFSNGSQYVFNIGASPLPQAQFKTGSTFVIKTNSISTSGATYANITVDGNTALSKTGSAASNFQFDSLNVVSGSSFSLNTTSTGGVIIRGDISSSGTGNISIASGGAIQVNGGGTQTFGGGGGTGTITLGSSATIASGTTVNLSRGLIVSAGTLTDSGTFNCASNSVTGAGAFTLSSGATLGIGDANGITSSGASGNIQVTGTRTFDAGANYTYNGSANQGVGNGLPSTVANLTIANTGGAGSNTVTGNSGQTVTALLRVQSGVFSTASTFNDVQIDSGATLSLAGPISLSGNWTDGGTFTPNGQTVTFNGTGTNQFVTRTGGGTETFWAIVLNKPSGLFAPNNGPATNLTINGTSGDVFQVFNIVSLQLNGQTVTFAGNGGNILTSGLSHGVQGQNGTLLFTGSKTITSSGGSTMFFASDCTVALAAAVNFGAGISTIAGTLRMDSGGSVSTNAPSYNSGSLLKYNSGGAYGRGTEWSATSGAGYPVNVQVSNNTTLDLGANGGTATARQIAVNLTIDSGSTLSMAVSPMTAALTVLGDIAINGTLALSTSSGGEVHLSGNWNDSGTFTPNDRAVVFDGTGTNQFVTRTGGGTETFARIVLNKPSGLFANNNSPATNITINGTSGDVLQIFNVVSPQTNSQTMTFAGNGGNILTSGLNHGFSGPNGTLVFTGSKTVTASGGGTMFFNSDLTVVLSAAVDFGAGISTIAGTLRIDSGGSVNTNPPTYNGTSLLKYNSTGTYGRAVEWSATSGAGFPNDVRISNNTTLDLGNGGASTARSIARDLTIDSGSTLTMATTAMTAALTVPRNVSNSGTLTMSTLSGGDMNVGGNWSNSGTFTPNSRTVTFNSNGNTQTLTGNSTFSNLTINHTGANSVTAAGSTLAVTGLLHVVSGTFTSATQYSDVTIDNGATLSLSGDISVSGTWTNEGTFNASGFTVAFNGTSNQTIGGAAATTFTGLTINNSAGVTLGVNTTVTGVLALTSGDLNTTNSFTLSQSGTSTGNGDVVGTVGRGDLDGTTRSFGNPNVQITKTAGSVTSFTVNLVKGLTPNDFANAVKRIYTLTPTGGSSFAATVRLHYLDAELNSNSEATLLLWRKDSSLGWQAGLDSLTTRDGTGDTNWVQLTGVATFSQWVISGPASPTDVAMLGFKATRYDKQVLLEWQTGYEVSNIGFNIYREKNGGLERITPEPVAGSALIAGPRIELKAGLAYSWIDEEAIADCGSGKTDCENPRYWIEDIDLNGRNTIHGPFGVSEGAIGGDQPGGEPGGQVGDRTFLSKRKSPLLSALGRGASLAQTAEAATVPVEPTAKVAKITAARMTIQSGVASQTAVKLSVQREGWYRVEQSDLTAAGLPSDANPAMLQLLADGKEVPMLVTGATSGTGGGGVIGGVIGGGGVGGGKTTVQPTWNGIEFYGLGINSASTVNHVYWLVVAAQPGLRITTSDATGGPVAPSSFSYAVERRDKTVYFPALKNGGAEKWFGPLMFNAQPVDQSVMVQHVAPSGGALLLVSLQGFNNTAHTVRVLNGSNLTIGEIVALAKASVTNLDVRRTWILLGDPATRLK